MRAVCWRRWPRPDTVHVCRLSANQSVVLWLCCGLQLSAPSSAIPTPQRREVLASPSPLISKVRRFSKCVVDNTSRGASLGTGTRYRIPTVPIEILSSPFRTAID